MSHIDVSLRSLTWPHIPRKFTRYSHLSSAFAPNRLFSSLGSAARVGSIPKRIKTLCRSVSDSSTPHSGNFSGSSNGTLADAGSKKKSGTCDRTTSIDEQSEKLSANAP
jgi:hypothetical protein